MHCTLVNMEVIVVEEKENPFLNRKELLLVIKHPASATPSKGELIHQLSLTQSVDESQIKVRYIFTKKGVAESLAKVWIVKKEEKVETQTNSTA